MAGSKCWWERPITPDWGFLATLGVIEIGTPDIGYAHVAIRDQAASRDKCGREVSRDFQELPAGCGLEKSHQRRLLQS